MATIHQATHTTIDVWIALRRELWPGGGADEHRADAEAMLSGPDAAAFLAFFDDGAARGFVEVAVRPCDVDGLKDRIGYVEGWYVIPAARRRGIGRQLVAAAEKSAVARGCAAMHSDAEIANTISRAAHDALGYLETQQLVHFKKSFSPSD